MDNGIKAIPGEMHAAAATLRTAHDNLMDVAASIGNRESVATATTSVLGEFGVATEYLAFCQAWHDQAVVTAGAVNQTAGAIDRAADGYHSTDRHAAQTISDR